MRLGGTARCLVRDMICLEDETTGCQSEKARIEMELQDSCRTLYQAITAPSTDEDGCAVRRSGGEVPKRSKVHKDGQAWRSSKVYRRYGLTAEVRPEGTAKAKESDACE
jgi:hypothetical protein